MKRRYLFILLLAAVPFLVAAGLGLSTWTALVGDLATGDLMAITDVSDTSQSSDGTSKKITLSQLVHDVSVDGKTASAISSNWAYDHENSTGDPHSSAGYMQDLSDDTTPSLGGDLAVGSGEIQSTGDVVIQLGDAAGSNNLEVEDSGSVAVATIDSDGGVTAVTGYFSGSLQGHVKVTNKTAAATLTDAEMNGIVFVDPTTAVSITLPAVEIGQTVCVYVVDTNTVSVDANASDRIKLSGTALDDGDKVSSTGTAGDFVCLIGDSASGWTTLGMSGTWTDGGP